MYKSFSLLFIFSLVNLTPLHGMQQMVEQSDRINYSRLMALFADPNCYFSALKGIPQEAPQLTLTRDIDALIRNFVFIPTESDQIRKGNGDLFSEALRSKDPYAVKKNKFLAYLKREKDRQHPKLPKKTLLCEMMLEQQDDAVQILIEYDPLNFNEQSAPLEIAIRTGYSFGVTQLLQQADINATAQFGTRLFYAAAYGYRHTVAFLLANPLVDINKTVEESPLIIAAGNGQVNTVNALLEGNAEVNAALKDGRTALFLAAINGHSDIVRALLEKNADADKATSEGITPLFIAAQRGHSEVVKILLEMGADPNKATSEGITPLFIAAQKGHSEVVKILLEMGADPNNKATAKGVTPLFIATENRHIKVVKALLGVNDEDALGTSEQNYSEAEQTRPKQSVNVDATTHEGYNFGYKVTLSKKKLHLKVILVPVGNENRFGDRWTARDCVTEICKLIQATLSTKSSILSVDVLNVIKEYKEIQQLLLSVRTQYAALPRPELAENSTRGKRHVQDEDLSTKRIKEDNDIE